MVPHPCTETPMNFDFSDDQKLLQQTARDYLAEHAPLTVCREILETDQPYAANLWKGAAEMGWQGAVIPEEYGGAGFGHLELAMIAEEVGRALAPIPFSSSVYFARAFSRPSSPASAGPVCDRFRNRRAKRCSAARTR